MSDAAMRRSSAHRAVLRYLRARCAAGPQRWWAGWACGVAAAATATVALAQAPSAAADIAAVVDDDRVECPQAAYTDLPSAIRAVPAGATIWVCAGRYAQPTVIDKPLRLLGAQAGRDARLRDGDLYREAVLVAGAAHFIVAADDVVIDGFALQLQLTEDGEGYGIQFTAGHSGFRILDNRLDDGGTTALVVNADGRKPSLIARNRFTGARGFAIFASSDEQAQIRNTTIRENLFDGAYLVADGNTYSGLSVVDNAFVDGADLSIADHNNDDDADDTAPFNENIEILGNSIAASAGTAIDLARIDGGHIVGNRLVGGAVSGIAASHINRGLQIIGNRVSGFARAGLQIGVSTAPIGLPQGIVSGVSAAGNQLDGNGTGIALLDAQAVRVSANRIDSSQGDGMQVDLDSVANELRDNLIRRSGGFDCRDESVGSGSAGTANNWLADYGDSASPNGLCVPLP